MTWDDSIRVNMAHQTPHPCCAQSLLHTLFTPFTVVTTGASVSIEGTLKESPGKGQRIELHAHSLTILGVADPATFPLQKKGHSMEFLREIAHLRPRTNTFGAVARVRNCISWSIHNFFQQRGFLYLNTPIITTSDCEGAGEMFQVTTLDLAMLAKKQGSSNLKGAKSGIYGRGRLLTGNSMRNRRRRPNSMGR